MPDASRCSTVEGERREGVRGSCMHTIYIYVTASSPDIEYNECAELLEFLMYVGRAAGRVPRAPETWVRYKKSAATRL